MKRKTNLKNRIFLIVMMLMTMVVSVNAATDCVYYAVLDENDSTLTFKFTEKSSSPNTYFYDIDTYIYSTEVKDDTPVWFNKRNSVKKVVFDSSFSQCRPMNCYGWFRDMRNLREIEGIEYLNTSYVTNMGYMFSGCYNLTTLDVSGFSTSEVSDMSHMFERCSKLKVLDVSGFYTAHVNDMKYMFAFCSALTTLDVSGFYTKRVTNMSNMFFDCRALTTLDVSGFNTYWVSSMTGMFDGCSSLTLLDVSNFDTSNVSSMKNMFQYCSSLTSLDLRGFDTSNVNDMSDMFYGCSVLATIYCNDSWSCERSVLMFVGCMKLRGGIEYTAGKTDVTYANPTTGYFTYKAADERPLCINGTTVTDINERDLTKIDGVQGTARYDNPSKTLTLTDAMIFTAANDTSAIQTNLDSLYIVVNGECMIGSTKLAGITGTSHVVIKGSGKLTVVGVNAVVLLQNLGSLTVTDGVQLDIQGYREYGINGCKALKVSGKDTKLSISGTTGSCKNLGALTLTDNLAIMDPLGAKYSNGTIVDIDGNEIKRVTIEYAEPYDLTLNGTQVTAANNSILNTIPGVTGTASYDPETKTLYLEDASITENSFAGGYAIKTTLDTLRINVTGDCNISSSKGVGLHSNSRNVVIGGTGTLNIDASVAGIVMNSTAANSLDIDGKVTVNVEADTYGMVGREVVKRLLDRTDTIYTTTLKVGGENSKLSVKGTEQSFLTLKAFEPADGYKVTSPSRTAFDPASNTFCRVVATTSGSGKTGTGTLVLTLVPVAGTAVVIEKPYILGDVNHDGVITMADANAVVNYFLATGKPSDFDKETADVNGDGSITMADANMIVNMFLGQ
jgi:surface protein